MIFKFEFSLVSTLCEMVRNEGCQRYITSLFHTISSETRMQNCGEGACTNAK
jgi:hypothetical protein